MTEGILLASSDTVDMIKGLYKYEVFGQEVWLTTSHVCILIVWLSLVIFSIIANHKLKNATEPSPPKKGRRSQFSSGFSTGMCVSIR